MRFRLDFGGNDANPARRDLLDYLYRLIILILFLFPVGFISTFFATFIHELLGHGLGGILVGGTLDGIKIHWSGQGLAMLSYADTIPKYDLSFVFMAGIFANLIIGAALIRVGLIRKIPYFPRLVIMLLGADSLMSAGAVYLFWNSGFNIGDYDMTQTLALYNSAGLKTFLVLSGLIVLISAVILVNVMMYRTLVEWLNGGEEGDKKVSYRIIMPLIILLLADSSRWATNRLLLDIGVWATISMIALTSIVLAGIYFVNPQVPFSFINKRRSLAPIIISYIVAFLVIVAVLVFF